MSWKELPGWAAFAHTVYDDYIDNRAKDGDVVVEVGVLFGRSLAYLARRAIDKGLKIEIHAVDPWIDRHWLPVGHPFRAIAAKHGGPWEGFLTEMQQNAPEELAYVGIERIHRMTSVEGAKLFADKTLAMVMLDDDHSLEGCTDSIRAWKEKVHGEGLFAGDDYDPVAFPAVVRAVKNCFGDAGYTVRGTSWLAGTHATMGPTLEGDWYEVETAGGTYRFGRVVGEIGSETVRLFPCYFMSPARVLVPLPNPGQGVSLNYLDVATPYVWGTGEETVVRFSTIQKIAAERALHLLTLENQQRGL